MAAMGASGDEGRELTATAEAAAVRATASAIGVIATTPGKAERDMVSKAARMVFNNALLAAQKPISKRRWAGQAGAVN